MSIFQHIAAWWMVGIMAILLPVPFTSFIFTFAITPVWLIVLLVGTCRNRRERRFDDEVEYLQDSTPRWNLS